MQRIATSSCLSVCPFIHLFVVAKVLCYVENNYTTVVTF